MHALRTITHFPDTFQHWSSPRRASFILIMTIILMLLCSITGAYSVRETALYNRMAESKHLVQAGINTMWFYHNQFVKGKMTEADAKSAAFSVIDNMHYAEANYIFAYSHEKPNEYILVANRVRPDLIGTNRYDAKSPDGVYYVQAGVNVAKNGGGYYAYLWNAGGTTQIVRQKISYAEDFAPWHTMIGTGVYIDDIFADFWNSVNLLVLLSALCMLIGSSVLTWGYMHRSRADARSVNNPR